MPVNLILNWEWELERKMLLQGTISQPLSLYLEGEEKRAQVKRKTNIKVGSCV